MGQLPYIRVDGPARSPWREVGGQADVRLPGNQTKCARQRRWPGKYPEALQLDAAPGSDSSLYPGMAAPIGRVRGVWSALTGIDCAAGVHVIPIKNVERR